MPALVITSRPSVVPSARRHRVSILQHDPFRDPSEKYPYPLHPSSPEYPTANATFAEAVAAHVQTLTPVPNQIALGQDKARAVCGDPQSQSKYPALGASALPNCTIQQPGQLRGLRASCARAREP